MNLMIDNAYTIIKLIGILGLFIIQAILIDLKEVLKFQNIIYKNLIDVDDILEDGIEGLVKNYEDELEVDKW